ncbi:AraC family ligand binding domain-containing protein [Patescibacteria group bacterium]
MKIVRKKDRIKYKNSDVCTAYEYHFGDKDINGAVIELNGRYPDKGKVVNRVCKEIVHVISGKGTLNINGKEFLIQKDDQALIEPGEMYFFEGKMIFFTPCTPSWYPEQHKEVD